MPRDLGYGGIANTNGTRSFAGKASNVTSVIGLAYIADEATARAILNDSRVSTATLRDELTALAEVRD